jgi:hypothetical protein
MMKVVLCLKVWPSPLYHEAGCRRIQRTVHEQRLEAERLFKYSLILKKDATDPLDSLKFYVIILK